MTRVFADTFRAHFVTRHPLAALGLAAALVIAGTAAAQETPADASAKESVTPRKVAILPLRVTDLQGNDVKRLNALVREGIAKRDAVDIQTEATTTELVDSALSLGLDCEINSVDCATRLGQLADVDFVVLGQATGFGDQIGLDIEIIDVASKRQLFRGARLVPAELDAQEIAVRSMVLAIFDPNVRSGLSVTSSPAGARLFVDGTERGVTPIVDVGGLIPGPHLVELRLDKHDPASEKVMLKPNEVRALNIKLVPLTLDRAPRTPVEIVLPFGVLAGGAVLAIAGGAAIGIGLEPLLAFNAASDAHEAALSDPVANAAVLAEQRAILEERSGQLNTWAMAAMLTGGAAAVVGSAVAVGGGIWGGLVVVDEFLVE